ncbi:MAG: acyltransferase domain-containing protein, partial [Pseudomonadales bacterium]|nr:acyltransferase domain-containing protein [Pseudomonadales bacterium]
SENFFDIGGHSILLAKVYSKLPEHLSRKLRLVDLFQFPTIQTLAHFLEDDVEEDDFYLEIDDHAERLRLRRRFMESFSGSKIAIVGMSGRFPGATSVERFWQNICDGEESITFFTDDELRESGVPEELIRNPDYVPAKGKLKNIDQFDANFFNFTAREAQITDPQQRIFLECAWEALEDACCVPEKFDGSIGVFAGTGINQYLTTHLSTHPELLATVGDYSVMIGNDKDFLASRVAYKLNLNGPAMVLQTACSTSLVAVHTACQSLLNEECDAALAGGVSLGPLGKAGYLYQEGMILSPDGHCRAFSADAKGTVQGQGCGVVVLKRLDDALKSHDNIYAVIVGSATNNDGSNKTGYTAPSVEGQAKVINMALATANLNPAKVGYIETHGTGTPLGDPIEIEGLRQAFKVDSGNTDKCAIGSVKTNIGHLDAASGVTGLIKAAKAINQCELPPSLHFSEPNPQIDFSKTHFYVNTALKRWEGEKMTRFAGVSSFGIGGTNAHVVLAEPPNQTLSEMSRPWRVVTLSARTATALDAATKRFVAYLQTNQTLADPNNFSNICYSLHVGRRLFPHRRYLVCRNADEAIAELTELDPQHVITSQHTDRPQKLVFMFSGQGSQYINMGSHLYRTELTFRKTINQCRKMLSEKFVHLYEEFTEEDHAGLTDKIHQTQIAQPGLFIFEYALAQTFISWNIKPDCLIGHSIGEFVAACLSGVFTLDQALELVTIRGNLMQGLEGGDMLSVNLPEEEALALTNHDVSLAAVNGPSRCVLSGTEQAINYLHQQLDIKGVENRILHTSHAFHSHMMEPILERFKAYVERRKPQPPKIPFVSSLTGEWITDEQATSAQYWADHLRYAVQFNKGLHTVFERTENNDQPALTTRYICLEMGPGKVLSTLARQHPAKQKQDVILASTRHAYEEVSDVYFLLKVIAKLWELGVPIDWEAYHSARQRYRVPLPTYPFERQSYWVKPRLFSSAEVGQKALSALEAENELGECAASHDARDVIGDVIGDASHVAPRDDIERKVYSSWRLSLGINDFDIHDNFFDLGGDSLVAVNLIAKIKTEFKIPIATPVLMQRQTVAELAEYIRHHRALAYDDSSADREASPLVLIQKGSGEKIPIIMVHPIGGEVFFYRDLAHHLGVDQTLYAFQAISLAGTSEPINSVSALADFYIQALKRRGLEPPYILGGSSFGGLVAYEMAQQLNEVHNKVSLVIMIDTPAPTEMPENLTSSAAILDYLLSDKLTLDNSKLATLDESAQIDYVLEAARGQGKGDVLPPHLGVPLFKTWFAHQEATRNYQPKDYRGDVIYFRHTEPQAHFPALPHRPWQAWVSGQFMIHQVPGSHVTMNFPPHVQVLASHLKPVIKEAQG